MLQQNCPYLVTFNLDLDLEHTLDADRPGDQCMYAHLRPPVTGNPFEFRCQIYCAETRSVELYFSEDRVILRVIVFPVESRYRRTDRQTTSYDNSSPVYQRSAKNA